MNIEMQKLENMRLLYNKYIIFYTDKIKDCQAQLKSLETAEIDRKETRRLVLQRNLIRYRRTRHIYEQELSFLRPRQQEDIEYRNRQYYSFSDEIKKWIPSNAPLRFHGCPIYTAKEIIESKEISSSVDRLGIMTSYDSSGQISVTTSDTISTTTKSYAGLLDNEYFLPAGCIFVVLPINEEDAKAGSSMLMGNVNFTEAPDRLIAIISTPENMDRLTYWTTENNIDSEKVFTYDGFIEHLKSIVPKQLVK